MGFIQEVWAAKQCKFIAIDVFNEQKYITTSMDDNAEILEDLGATTVYKLIHFNTPEELAQYAPMMHSSRHGMGHPMTYYRHEYTHEQRVTGDDAKIIRYAVELADLDEVDRFILDNVIFELQEKSPEQLPAVTKLVKVGKARLRKHGFYVECSRCGGTGHYSYCQMYGTTCFKCGGNKMYLPKFTKKWQKSVKEFDWKAAYTEQAQPEAVTE